MKSELAIKRDEWFGSEEGRKCCDAATLGHIQPERFLRNRLERAFLAGAKADAEVQQEFCDRIDKIAAEINYERD